MNKEKKNKQRPWVQRTIVSGIIRLKGLGLLKTSGCVTEL